MRHVVRLAWVILFILAIRVAAEEDESAPATSTITTPLAARSGTSTDVVVANGAGGKPTGLWTSFPADVTPQKDNRFTLRVPATCPAGIYGARLLTSKGASALQLFMIDDLATVSTPAGNVLVMPCAVEGTMSPLTVATYRVAVRKGQRVSVDVAAGRLGSPLDPIVRLLDPAGRELAYCDDAPGIAPDARLTAIAPVDGVYQIELRDSAYEGGTAYRYRLRVGDFALPTPAFPPQRDDAIAAKPSLKITLPASVAGRLSVAMQRDVYLFDARAGDRVAVRVFARTLGSRCEPLVSLMAPDGNAVAEQKPPEPKAETKQAAPPITEGTPLEFNLPVAGLYNLTVEDLARVAAPDAVYRLEIEGAGFDLSSETDMLVAPTGGSVKLKVKCDRRMFGGAVELHLADVSEDAVKLVTTSLLSGQTDGEVELKLLSAHATTFRLVGTAMIDGHERSRQLSTLPALRKAFPRLMYPPSDLDGLVMVAPKME